MSEEDMVRRSERIREQERLLAEKFEVYWKRQCEEYQKMHQNKDFNSDITYNLGVSLELHDIPCRSSGSAHSQKETSSVILYTCAFCLKKVQNMEKHIKKHLKNTLHPCAYCGKKFPSLSALRTHIRVHTGEKPYRCTVCWKAFSQNGTVKIHMLSHTGEKPHTCKICQKAFREKGHLSRHVLIHTGEKPYKCNVCGRAFNQTNSVKKHIFKVHNLEVEGNVIFLSGKKYRHL